GSERNSRQPLSGRAVRFSFNLVSITGVQTRSDGPSTLGNFRPKTRTPGFPWSRNGLTRDPSGCYPVGDGRGPGRAFSSGPSQRSSTSFHGSKHAFLHAPHIRLR